MAKGRVRKGATPAVAALEAAGVGYKLRTHAVDADVDDYGVAVAHALGVDPARVYKTLVACRWSWRQPTSRGSVTRELPGSRTDPRRRRRCDAAN
jgi:hypothetical protein